MQCYLAVVDAVWVEQRSVTINNRFFTVYMFLVNLNDAQWAEFMELEMAQPKHHDRSKYASHAKKHLEELFDIV